MATQQEMYRRRIEFEVGIYSRPHQYSQGPFGVLLGSWFLNYAPDFATLMEMWRNAAINLSPIGSFIGIAPTATNDSKQYTIRRFEKQASKRSKIMIEMVHEIEDGVRTLLTAIVEP